MATALLPGTFDPPTLGHLDIIQRAAKMCDTLYIGIAEKAAKKPTLFSVEERIRMLDSVTRHLDNVIVESFGGLVADFAIEREVTYLIRGIRAFSDLEYELRMAYANRKMSGIETMFLAAKAELSHISSSLVRQIAVSGKHLEDFVPKGICRMIYERVENSL